MTATPLCGEAYRRPDGAVLTCQYVPRHAERLHSWYAAESLDRATPLARLLDDLGSGRFDDWLEAILAAAHARKRALRGVPGPYGI